MNQTLSNLKKMFGLVSALGEGSKSGTKHILRNPHKFSLFSAETRSVFFQMYLFIYLYCMLKKWKKGEEMKGSTV